VEDPLPPGSELSLLKLELLAISRFAIQQYLMPRDSSQVTPLPNAGDALESLELKNLIAEQGEWGSVARQLLVSVRLHSFQLFLYFLLLFTTILFVVFHVDFKSAPKLGPFIGAGVFITWAALSLWLRQRQIEALKRWVGGHKAFRPFKQSAIFFFRPDRPEDHAWEELVDGDFDAEIDTFGLNHMHTAEFVHAALLLTAFELLAKIK
jgi:hypothetical protein